MTVALSPILIMWTVIAVKRPDAAASAIPVIGGVLALVYVSLLVKTVTADESGMTQGWRPFATRIAYADVDRIHLFVSNRYGSSPNLAITARGGRKDIRLPTKSFNLEKLRWLVERVMAHAPNVRIDPHLTSLYSPAPRNRTAS